MTTNTTPVARTASSEAEQAVAVIVLAFSADPAARWSFAEPHQYLTHFTALVRAFGGRAFDHGSGDHLCGFGGAALWLPPGVHPDEEVLTALLKGSMEPARYAEAVAVFEQMARHHPREPHWYLPLIGVDPSQQRKGHGSALLQHGLLRCDRDHVPAYLESTNPVNVPLYERHGFEVVATIQVGSSPPIFPMLRSAR